MLKVLDEDKGYKTLQVLGMEISSPCAVMEDKEFKEREYRDAASMFKKQNPLGLINIKSEIIG